MKRILVCALLALAALCWAQAVLAAGPHDLDCMDCHSTHYAKGDYIIGVEPNTRAVNPATSRVSMSPAEIDALCLGCHNEQEGIMPVNLATTHPTGVKPVRTPVPQELLWDGVFSCTSCHDPHPANTNAKYLIVDTAQGMGVFCAQCHPHQTDPDVLLNSKNAAIRNDPPFAPIVRITGTTPAPAETPAQ